MRIAVYGTLRKGQGNYYAFDLEHTEHIKTCLLKGYSLFVRGLPFAVPDKQGSIVVDVFDIPLNVFDAINRMEQGAGYELEETTLRINGKLNFLFLWVYKQTAFNETDRVLSGDYLEEK